MRAVVTGGAGFVGSNLVAALLERGDHVTVVDDFFTGQQDAIPSGVDFYAGCVTDYALMLHVCRRADVVYHLAARNIIVSTINPADDFRVNAGGTLNVLMAAREEGVPRVVYASSCSVYGDRPRLPIVEDDPVSLLSPYAASKFSGEAYCQAFGASYGLRTTVVRYSNVYGPGHRPENPYCGVIARFIHDAMAGRAMRVNGSGKQTRDYTYVGDIVAATILAADAPAGSVYNVATGKETSVNRLTEMIGGPVAFVASRDIDNVSRRSLDATKIRNELGWEPRMTLAEGLYATRSWMLSRPIA